MAKDFFCENCDLYKTSCAGSERQFKLNCIEGIGNPNADIMIVGMCPGQDECKTKEPFTGESGQKLNECLRAVGLKREDVFITNLVRCRPPRVKKSKNSGYEDRQPLAREIKACREYLDKDIAEVNPRVIIMLGNVVTKALTGETGITKIHGTPFWNEDYGATCIPCYHPSFLIRRPDDIQREIEFIEDLKFAKEASKTSEFTDKPRMETKYKVCDTLNKANKLLDKLETLSEFVYDIETTGLRPDESELLCIGFSWKEGTGVAIPFREYFRYFTEEDVDSGMFDKIYEERDEKGKKLKEPKFMGTMVYELEDYWESKESESIKNRLIKILSNDKIKKIAHNISFDVGFMSTYWNFEVRGAAYDTMYGDYLPDPERKGGRKLEDLAWIYTDMGGYDEGLKKERENGFRNVDPKELYEYACADSDCEYRIFKKQKEAIKPFIYVMENIMVPLSIAIWEMEYNGITVDIDRVHNLISEYEARIEGIYKELYNLEGVKEYVEQKRQEQAEIIKTKWLNSKALKKRYKAQEYIDKNIKEFNFASTKDLRGLLFEHLKLPVLKTTGTNLASTKEEVLEMLRGKHKVVDCLLELRHLNKVYSTYLKPVPDLVDENNRLHTSFRLDRTATGRLSSSNPNLQNIPKKKDGKEIRDYFTASPGNVLVESDLKQIEYRILAHFVNDKKMIKDIEEGLDIHSKMASKLYKIGLDEFLERLKSADKEIEEKRNKSKAVVYGIPYGRGPVSIAGEYGMPIEEAERFMSAFFNMYPKVPKWIDRMIDCARDKGYVKTYFNRIRHLTRLNDQNKNIRESEERKVVSTAIQGTASDILSIYTINIAKKLKEIGSKTKIVLTVHDALFFDMPKDEVKRVIPIIRAEMEKPIQGIRVPIETEIKIGKRWGSLVEYEDARK